MSQHDALSEQLSHHGLIWLTLAQCSILLLWLGHTPLWLLAVLAGSFWYRWKLIHGQFKHIEGSQKLLLITGLATILIISRGGVTLDLHMFSDILLLAYIIKGIETEHEKDCLTLIFLGFFILAIRFLFSQDLSVFLFSLVVLVFQIAALQSVIQRHTIQNTHYRFIYFKNAISHVIFALPLTLMLFLFFPRLSPLWSVPLDNGSAVSGLSHQLSVGDISELKEVDGIAFRADFVGEPPKSSELYWRAMTLNYFDGNTWYPQSFDHALLRKMKKAHSPTLQSGVKQFHYNVFVEPNYQRWLYTLASPITAPQRTKLNPDSTLQALNTIEQPFGYTVTSWPDAFTSTPLPDLYFEIDTQLPKGNPLTRAFAKTLFSQANKNTNQFVHLLNQYLSQHKFIYTLTPETLPKTDSIDAFWFNKKAGFCGHYAQAIAFILRSQKIPARIVTGYLGGQWSDNREYISVRQMDAHAWVEYWQSGKGWVRFDPTKAIAPERITGSILDIQNEDNLANQINTDRHIFNSEQLLPELSMLHDKWRFYWQKWILNFDESEQLSIYQRYLGGFAWYKLGLIFIFCFGGLLFSLFLLFKYKNYHKGMDPVQKALKGLERHLAKKGTVLAKNLSPGQQLLALAQHSNTPEKWQALATLLNEYFYTNHHKKGLKHTLLKHIRQSKRWHISH